MARRNPTGIVVLAIVAVAAVISAIGLVGAGAIRIPGLSSPTTTTTTTPLERVFPQADRAVAAAERLVGVRLPTREGAPAPALPGVVTGVGGHEVVGFVPAYELGDTGKIDFADFSEIVYSSVSLLASGGLDPTSFGDVEIHNGATAQLVRAAHSAGDPVLLSLALSDQSSIDTLVSAPRADAARTAIEAASLMRSQGFDGLDLDVEGENAADSAGYTAYVAALARDLRAKNPSWSILVNTYPGSAVGPAGFFDVKQLAKVANQLFVMAYDMNDLEIPSATAPLTGTDLSDSTALATYVDAGLGRKVLLGIPFYGYDFPASRAKVPADTAGTPYSVTYDDVVSAGHPVSWDPVTETPYTVFRRGSQWHQTWFDDPVSVALKTALAWQFHVAGVGVWEVGMAAGQPQMTAALLDGGAATKLPLAAQG
jgi:hypothetical protein